MSQTILVSGNVFPQNSTAIVTHPNAEVGVDSNTNNLLIDGVVAVDAREETLPAQNDWGSPCGPRVAATGYDGGGAFVIEGLTTQVLYPEGCFAGPVPAADGVASTGWSGGAAPLLAVLAIVAGVRGTGHRPPSEVSADRPATLTGWCGCVAVIPPVRVSVASAREPASPIATRAATRSTRETRDRILSLVIPPAWTDVWISPYPNGHIQATGVDAAGRRQYLYHPDWRIHEDRVKFDRALDLAATLPAARRGVTIDLRREGVPRERALAGGFRMLDVAGLRVGHERYAEEHGSYGLTTLLGSHVHVVGGDTVELRFPAKSGQAWESEVQDPDLAELVALLKRRGPRAHLLAWRGEDTWHPVSAAELNADVRERAGSEFTSKDFRTLHGTIAAAASLAVTGPKSSESARKRAVAEAMRVASAVLGNTPAIARSSYVDPRVLDRYRHGETLDPAAAATPEVALRRLLLD